MRDLTGLSQTDIEIVGAKAANLGEMAKAGFPVPDGFVLTVEAFTRFISANGIGASSPVETVLAASLPEEVSNALLSAISQFDHVPLAVRSSGVAEDMAGASFAGQYETVLDVRGIDAVIIAVKHCWASAFSSRVAAYKESRGVTGLPKMALLVQRMVVADASGVVFTANPVNGNRDETMVSAVRGLGERLVSGKASPDEWIVKGTDVTCQSAPENAVNSVQVLEIADLARRIEHHFGTPQDIEWAISDKQLFLLQARPITTLSQRDLEPIPVPVQVPDGFWERESSHFSQPFSPLMRSAYLPAHISGMANMCRELSLPFEKLDFREIGGWVYQRLVPLGGKDRKPPPNWVMYLLVRLVPMMRSRIRGMTQHMRNDTFSAFVNRWYNEWKPNQIKQITQLRSVELSKLSDEDLNEHLTVVLGFLSESLKIHALVTGIEFSTALLAFTCRDLFGWDDKQTLRLLSGLSTTTSEASSKLAELSQMVRKQPALRQLFESGNENRILEQLDIVAPDFAKAFTAYQKDFGCRAMAFEVALPTVAEIPSLAINLIRNQVRRSYDPRTDTTELSQERNAALTSAKELLANRSPMDRQRFERDLNRARRAYPVREDHEFYLGQAPLALLRYTALEIGHRLVQRGQIDERDDVFWLEVTEIRTALQEGGEQRPLVQRRKAERFWVEAHPGPASYGKSPGPPPPLSPFPQDARIVMAGVLWLMERVFAAEVSVQTQKSGDNIKGIAASSGKYTGTVRVILNEGEFSKLQPGDVMVCPTTSPVWSILFPSVGALVTDSGGILSHPAIIAREYRVPAVVATGNATQILRDGETVTVDGGTGIVKVELK